jgi:hypothetical protein
MKGKESMKQKILGLFLFSLLSFTMSCGESKSSDDGDAGADSATTADQETDTGPYRPPYTPPDGDDTSDTGDEPEGDAGPEDCIHTEPCEEPTPFERALCHFPLTPTLDGDLGDDAWASAPWVVMDSSTAATNPENTLPDDDADLSMEFACVADDEFIYFAFRVRDDSIVADESSGCDVWQDDSVEFYLDGCYERGSAYNGDEAQIAFGAENIGITNQDEIIIGGCVGRFQGPETGTQALAVETEDGWAGEMKVPLRFEGDDGWQLEPLDGQVVGFNVHYNDDDDEMERDHKLIWSLIDRPLDKSWESPLQFGELQFCSILEPDTETGSDMEPDAGPDAGPDTEMDSATDTGGESEPDTGSDSETDTGMIPGTDIDTETATETTEDTETATGPDTGPGTDVDSATAMVLDTDTETSTGPDSESDTGSAHAPDAGPDSSVP